MCRAQRPSERPASSCCCAGAGAVVRVQVQPFTLAQNHKGRTYSQHMHAPAAASSPPLPTSTRIETHTCILACTLAHAHAHTHAVYVMRSHIQKQTHTQHAHTRMLAHARTYARTRAHTHTYTHTQMGSMTSALARLHCRPDISWLEECLAVSRHDLTRAGAAHLVRLVSALAALRFRPGSTWMQVGWGRREGWGQQQRAQVLGGCGACSWGTGGYSAPRCRGRAEVEGRVQEPCRAPAKYAHVQQALRLRCPPTPTAATAALAFAARGAGELCQDGAHVGAGGVAWALRGQRRGRGWSLRMQSGCVAHE